MRTKFTVVVISVLVTLAVMEGFLRLFVCDPGLKMQDKSFSSVSKLKTYSGYTVTQEGITCVDTAVYNSYRWQNVLFRDGKDKDVIIGLATRTLLRSTFGYKTNLTEYLKTAVKNPDKVDTAILEFLKHPVNSNGFKSIEFKNYSSKKKKILMLGDSFAWGHSSKMLMNGFCEQLLAKGNIVFNTGITGADPAQYLAIAKKYTPLLKPDVVVVNLFLGNDVYYYKRQPEKRLPLFYSTNAGNMLSFFNGYYFYSADSAYDYALSQLEISHSYNKFNKFCSLTAIGTLCWRITHKYFPGLTEDAGPRFPTLTPMSSPSCNDEIAEIKKICETNNARLIVAIIPCYQNGRLTKVSDYKNLLTGIKYFECPFETADYSGVGGHLNDEGHGKYAEFLQTIIDTVSLTDKM